MLTCAWLTLSGCAAALPGARTTMTSAKAALLLRRRRLFLIFAARHDGEIAQRLGAGAEVLMPVRPAGHAAQGPRSVVGAMCGLGFHGRLVFLQVARFRPDVVARTFEDDEDRLIAVLVGVGLRADELADVHVRMRTMADGRHHVEERGPVGA